MADKPSRARLSPTPVTGNLSPSQPMAPIYSAQLVNGVIGLGTHTAYTVPAGATVVLTNIDACQDFAAAGEVSYVSIGAAIVLYVTSAAAGQFPQQWQGKQVLTGGQTISVTVGGFQATFGITGYLLN